MALTSHRRILLTILRASKKYTVKGLAIALKHVLNGMKIYVNRLTYS